MTNQEFIETIRDLVSSNKTEIALKLLMERGKAKRTDLLNDIALITSKFSSDKNSDLLGLITKDEYKVSITKTHLGIINTAEKFAESYQKSKQVLLETNINPYITNLNTDTIKFGGVEKVSIITQQQAEDGHLHKLEYGDYPSPHALRIYFSQVALNFRVEFLEGYNYSLPLYFDIGREKGEPDFVFRSNIYFITQWDIDMDGIKEIFVGLIDRKNNSEIEIHVIKYHPPFFVNDVLRKENWSFLDKIKVSYINTIPELIFVNNSLRAKYHFRGFMKEWHFVKDKFVVIDAQHPLSK